jgi:hypothetical protein
MRLFEKDSYKNLVIKNNYNTIEFLFNEGMEFAIVAYTNIIEFNPQIPKSVIKFEKQALFAIAGYSYESAILKEKHLIFEAGFGKENFGSVLTVPLEAIAQIIIDNTLLNISYYEPKVINSMDILLKNPENLKLINKRKRNKK